ncbi:MAG TPA: hypothetical protein VFO07_11620 [Roseiflexaceae bacterium]|nr:hypothetical protein [Roseiflexaceae bacterium]
MNFKDAIAYVDLFRDEKLARDCADRCKTPRVLFLGECDEDGGEFWVTTLRIALWFIEQGYDCKEPIYEEPGCVRPTWREPLSLMSSS